jgi:hypothetical protein
VIKTRQSGGKNALRPWRQKPADDLRLTAWAAHA